MKASLMRPIPPGSTRSVSTGSSATYTNAALPVEITEERIRLSDDSNDYVTHTHAFLRRVYVVYKYIYIYIYGHIMYALYDIYIYICMRNYVSI